MATEASNSIYNTIMEIQSTSKSNKKRKTDELAEDDLEDQLSMETLVALTRPRSRPSKWAKVDRSTYPEESKKIYLSLKKLSMKKLKLASHIQETTSMLKNGKFPSSINFKCLPINAGGDLDYLTEWASITTCCKKDLTLLYLDHMKSGNRDVKNEMNLHLLQLEELLNDDQLQEVVTFIKVSYKEAGNKASQRAKGNFQEAQPPRKPQRRTPSNRKGKAGKRHLPKVKPSTAATTAERKDKD
jgi:hypothetical protein